MLPVADSSADAVERQVAAYNAHDAEAFADCYSEGVVIEDAHGEVSMRGRTELRQRYAALFAANPTLHAEIRSRIRVGSYVIDDEYATGHPAGEVHAVAIYRIAADGLIEHVRFLR